MMDEKTKEPIREMLHRELELAGIPPSEVTDSWHCFANDENQVSITLGRERSTKTMRVLLDRLWVEYPSGVADGIDNAAEIVKRLREAVDGLG